MFLRLREQGSFNTQEDVLIKNVTDIRIDFEKCKKDLENVMENMQSEKRSQRRHGFSDNNYYFWNLTSLALYFMNYFLNGMYM